MLQATQGQRRQQQDANAVLSMLGRASNMLPPLGGMSGTANGNAGTRRSVRDVFDRKVGLERV